MSQVYVLYNAGKLRAVYKDAYDASYDLQLLIDKGYKEARVQEVQLQATSREARPLELEEIDALKRCVERS